MRQLTFVATAFVSALVFRPCSSFADFAVESVSISPAAEDVSDQVPPMPPRQIGYAWRGQIGADYEISFQVSQEPAFAVAVGALISSTSYDDDSGIFTVSLTYNSDGILTDDLIDIPSGSFLVVLDPGISATAAAARIDNQVMVQAASSTDCYGPGANPDLYKDDSNDFGDPGGLLDPVKEDNESVGLPASVHGSFASTNAFYWCLVPPTLNRTEVGLRLKAQSGKRGTYSFHASESLLDYLSDKQNTQLTASNLALFNGEVQVSTDVQGDDGVSVTAIFDFIAGQTSLIAGSTGKKVEDRRAKNNKVKAAADTDSLVAKTLTLAKRELITIVPDNTDVTDTTLDVSGVVDDPELVGSQVQILRVAIPNCRFQVLGVTGAVVARGTVSSDGSYNIDVPAKKLFVRGSKTATIVARIVGNTIRQSREITLTNKNRGLRR